MMNDSAPLLRRIADALDRLAPPAPPPPDLASAPAYRWDGARLAPVSRFAPLDLALLTCIDAQKSACLENTRRLAMGHAAHDVLLWGARGTGKSATVAACVGAVQAQGWPLALIEVATDDLRSLGPLLALLETTVRPVLIFLDDLGFDDDFGNDARALRSLLEGGATSRREGVRLYATSNRRHIVPRKLSEQEDPIHMRDVVDDRLALGDRFGLSLGFHAMDQEGYLAIVGRYATAHDLRWDREDAIRWAIQRGARSGRVAWQYVVELAGRAGRSLNR